jgi:uncharacterized membrane protein YphA (DoxX/SURF4 family)
MIAQFFSVVDTLHSRRRARNVVWGIRITLAIAFILGAIEKIWGERFKVPGVTFFDYDLKLFFEAMYRTGLYWRFLGWAQCVSGVLLLIPRTALLGALLYMSIITNIVFITYSMDFRGIAFLTTLMWLGCALLLVWDYKRLKPILHTQPSGA